MKPEPTLISPRIIMDKEKLQKLNKEGGLRTEDVSGFSFITNLFRGIGNILNHVVKMEENNLNEHILISQIEGKARNGKKLKMQYGVRTRIGLDNFIKHDKSK